MSTKRILIIGAVCLIAAFCLFWISRKGPNESIAYVAAQTFGEDCRLGHVKIYYPAYSPMNINAANAKLNATGLFVVGTGDLIQSHKLQEYQDAYNRCVSVWLAKERKTSIDTLLHEFNGGGLQPVSAETKKTKDTEHSSGGNGG
jgi:hypothetical protein